MNDRELNELYQSASASDRERPSRPVRRAILSQAARSAHRLAVQRRAEEGAAPRRRPASALTRLFDMLEPARWSRWQIAVPVAAALIVAVILVPARRFPPVAPTAEPAASMPAPAPVPAASSRNVASRATAQASAGAPQAFPQEVTRQLEQAPSSTTVSEVIAPATPPPAVGAPAGGALAMAPHQARAAPAPRARAGSPPSAIAQRDEVIITVTASRVRRQDLSAPTPLASITVGSGDLQAGAADAPLAASARQIQQAAAEGNTERLEALLSERPELIESVDGQGRTPLMIAVLQQQRSTVELLLARGANPHAADNGGRTPLQIAIEKSDPDIRAALMHASSRAGHSGTR